MPRQEFGINAVVVDSSPALAEVVFTSGGTVRNVQFQLSQIKRVFGFTKMRYRGLEKNAQRLFVTCALANLFIVRDHLLRCQGS